MPVPNLSAFFLVALLIVAVPGPSTLFVIGRALTLGRRGAVITAMGNATGTLVQVVAVAVGVGALVERSILAFTVLKFAGAAYLVFLGVQAFRHRRVLAVRSTAPTEPARTGRVLREGFLVGVTNPKTTVFFTAALPPFVDPAAGAIPVQMMILGVVFLGIGLVTDSIWALSAGTARTWLARSSRRIESIGAASGLVMIGLGARVAFTGRPD